MSYHYQLVRLEFHLLATRSVLVVYCNVLIKTLIVPTYTGLYQSVSSIPVEKIFMDKTLKCVSCNFDLPHIFCHTFRVIFGLPLSDSLSQTLSPSLCLSLSFSLSTLVPDLSLSTLSQSLSDNSTLLSLSFLTQASKSLDVESK